MKSYLTYLYCGLFVLSNFSLCKKVNADEHQDNNYSYQLVVLPEAQGSLQKVELPNNFYWHDVANEFNDIAVIDADGQLMPFEISRINTTKNEITESEVKLYPIYEQQYLNEKTDNIELTYNENKQLKNIQKSRLSDKIELTVGYIIDLQSEVKIENSQYGNVELEFELSQNDKTSFLHFNIDQSSDLKTWSRLKTNEVLIQLHQDQNITQHNVIQINSNHSRYLRLSITDNQADKQADFEILSVKQKYQEKVNNKKLLWQTIKFEKQDDSTDFIAEIPANITLENLKFDLSDGYHFIKGRIYYLYENHYRKRRLLKRHTYEKMQWLNFTHFSLYQIKDGDNLIIENNIKLNGLKTTSLKLQLDNPLLEKNNTTVTAQIGWQAESLTFLASGKPPYNIVAGYVNDTKNNQAAVNHYRQNQYHQNQMIQNIKQNLKEPIKNATIISESINQENIKDKNATDNKLKNLLWLLMIAGVGLMFWMAKSLLKQTQQNK